MDEPESSVSYPHPVARLLTLGDPRGIGHDWPDYAAMGLSADHIPDLIRVVQDEALYTAEEDSTEVWGTLHAWRALGQFRAEAAVEPLLALLHLVDEEGDDWVDDEVPEALCLIGPVAMPALAAYLGNAEHGTYARVGAGRALAKIAAEYPEVRDDCVAAITAELGRFAENDEELNGLLISELLDLEAVESASVMERAFAANAVDLSIMGDWEEVQIELGLLEKRRTPKPKAGWLLPRFLPPKPKPAVPLPQKAASRGKAKKNRKAQKKARKKNRRK